MRAWEKWKPKVGKKNGVSRVIILKGSFRMVVSASTSKTLIVVHGEALSVEADFATQCTGKANWCRLVGA